MVKRLLSVLSAALLGLLVLGVPAEAAPEGCTTSVEWVQEGSNYWYGKGNIQCATGTYKAKLVCRNQQTGLAYVKYGTAVVSAPSTATATCDTGNVAEAVHASEEPTPPSMGSCVGWAEWVHEGNNHYYGRGVAQCDSGSYQVKINCKNLQSGQVYDVVGQRATAPATATGYCNNGNVAQVVTAIPA